jgi:uncharacterized protein DUF4349
MNARRSVRTILVALPAVLLVACGTGAAGGGSGSARSTQASLAAPAPAPVAQGPGASAGAPAGQAALPAPPPVDAEGQKIIRKADLTISVRESLGDALTKVEDLVRGEGGYISGSAAQAPGGQGLRTGTFSFQVPAANFDATLDRLRALGTVESFNVTGQDVSLQYVDLQARLANAQAQLAAYQALLGRASSIQDIISIQNQLGQVTSQIEQLKGQIDYYDHATSFHTISVTIREAGAPAKAPADEYGTRTALQNALHNFLATVNLGIEALGAAGPFLVLALLGLGGYRVWRRRLTPAAA